MGEANYHFIAIELGKQLRGVSPEQRANLVAWYCDMRFLTFLALVEVNLYNPDIFTEGTIRELTAAHRASDYEGTFAYGLQLIHGHIGAWFSTYKPDYSIIEQSQRSSDDEPIPSPKQKSQPRPPLKRPTKKKSSRLSVFDIFMIVVGVFLVVAAIALFIYLTIQTLGIAPTILGTAALAGIGGGTAGAGVMSVLVGMRKKIAAFFSGLFSRESKPSPRKAQRPEKFKKSAPDKPSGRRTSPTGSSNSPSTVPTETMIAPLNLRATTEKEIYGVAPLNLGNPVSTKAPEDTDGVARVSFFDSKGQHERDRKSVDTVIHSGAGLMTGLSEAERLRILQQQQQPHHQRETLSF